MATTFPTVLNNVATTLGAAYVSGPSLTLASGYGATITAKLAAESQPSLSGSNWLRVTVDNGTTQAVFQATALTGDVLTVELIEGSVPGGGFAVGAAVQGRWTSATAREIFDAINTLEGAGGGTVTSVAISVPTGLSVSGSPVTTSGTLAVTLGVSGVLVGSSGSIVAGTPGTDFAAASHTHAAAGSAGNVQYNNAGVIAGFGSWNGSTLAVTGSISATTTLNAGGSAGAGEVRSYQDGTFFVALKTVLSGTNKSGLFRSNTDFFAYYSTNDGTTNFDATYAPNPYINFRCLGTRVALVSPDSLRLDEGIGIEVGTTTGTKIGMTTSQKLGFWNKTPVVQPAAVADATDAASVIARLNDLLSRLRATGLIAT